MKPRHSNLAFREKAACLDAAETSNVAKAVKAATAATREAQAEKHSYRPRCAPTFLRKAWLLNEQRAGTRQNQCPAKAQSRQKVPGLLIRQLLESAAQAPDLDQLLKSW